MASTKGNNKAPQKKKEPSSQSTTSSPKSPKGKSKTPILLIAFGVMLLCCACGALAGGIYWFFLKDSAGPVYNEAPSVDILSPTGVTWYSTEEGTIELSGTADDVDGEVKQVSWAVEGGDSGSANGTESWNSGSVPLKEGDNSITVTATDNQGNEGTDKIFVVYNKDVLFVGELTSTPDFLFTGDPAVSVTFSTSIKKSPNQKLSSVKLVRTDQDGNVVKQMGQMKDSGKPKEGDDVPGDGTYGYKKNLKTNKSEPTYYRVVAQVQGSSSPSMSGVMKLISVDHVSQNTLNEIDNLNEQVNNLMDQLDQQGTDMQDMANQINDLVGQQENIAANGISEQGHGVWWVYENTCIPGGVLFTEPGVKGGSEESATGELTAMTLNNNSLVPKAQAQNLVEVQNTKALYLGPYIDDFGQTDDYYGAWELIKNSTCPECETTEKKGNNVKVDDFKNLSNYGLIVVSSHGDNWYGGLSGDNMCAEGLQQSQVITYTSQKLTPQNLPKYEADLMARRLAVGVNGNLVVLPSYISHYNGRFPNSLVYIATCRSSYNNTLQSAFLGKGAGAYFGFDDYVLSSYCFNVGKELFDNFVLQSDDAQTSFSDSVSSAGSSDGQGADFIWGGEGSLVMGGKSFVNTSFETGNMNGWSEAGDTRVIFSLGPLTPTEGDYMSIISTGLGSVSESKSTFTQSICLGTTGNKLSFDYQLVSEEPREYLNSKFDDKLKVFLIVDGNQTNILTAGVNNSTWSKVNGINFDGGDNTTFKTGWNTFSYSLADVPQGASVKIKFQVTDVGDSAYDTAALIDNVRIN